MKTVLKISVVLIMVISLLYIARENGSRAMLRNANKQILESAIGNDTAVFFVGSSRVQYGVNDSLLQAALHCKIFNCGFSNATFFSNAVIVTGLIKQGGKKIIVTELSPLIPDIPPGSSEFMQVVGIYQPGHIHRLLQNDGIFKNRQAYISLLNQFLVNSITLENEIKSLFDPGFGKRLLTGFRYKSINSGGYKKTDSFLEKSDLESAGNPHPQTSRHLKYISQLASLAAEHGVKLVFMLPVLYRDPIEKELVRSVFHSLPDSLRLTYSPGFLDQVSNPAYLYDIMHFNKNGADKFSSLLVPVIDSLRRTF